MNANELADELEIAQGNNNADELIPKAIAMLRQQHTSLISDVDVIERLTKEIKVKDEAIFNSEKQAYNLAMQVQNQKAEIEKYKIAVFAMECFRNALETSVRRTALESVWEALDSLEEK